MVRGKDADGQRSRDRPSSSPNGFLFGLFGATASALLVSGATLVNSSQLVNQLATVGTPVSRIQRLSMHVWDRLLTQLWPERCSKVLLLGILFFHLCSFSPFSGTLKIRYFSNLWLE